MNKILSFENFINEEVNPTSSDTSLIASLAKKIYSDLKGKGYKVTLTYQNAALSKKGRSKELGKSDFKDSDFRISYFVNYLFVDGEKIGEVSEELIKKYSSVDVEAVSPEEDNYNHLVFRLKEKSRSWDSARNRTKYYGLGGSNSYTMANKSQRKKGIVGTSNKKAFTEKPI
jgi:hypothetical protein